MQGLTKSYQFAALLAAFFDEEIREMLPELQRIASEADNHPGNAEIP